MESREAKRLVDIAMPSVHGTRLSSSESAVGGSREAIS